MTFQAVDWIAGAVFFSDGIDPILHLGIQIGNGGMALPDLFVGRKVAIQLVFFNRTQPPLHRSNILLHVI